MNFISKVRLQEGSTLVQKDSQLSAVAVGRWWLVKVADEDRHEWNVPRCCRAVERMCQPSLIHSLHSLRHERQWAFLGRSLTTINESHRCRGLHSSCNGSTTPWTIPLNSVSFQLGLPTILSKEHLTHRAVTLKYVGVKSSSESSSHL